jgi:hypothetical protein
MTIIRVPKTPASAMNPDRPVSSLLKNQIEHLQAAEFRLPARQQTNIYINKIKTERQAAEYIRQVTARLHPEGAMVASTGKAKAKSRVLPRIAAAAESGSAKNSKPKSRSKSRSAARKKTKKR